MIEVIHILKDGTRLEDITGHIVKISDAEPVYNLMTQINRRAAAEREKKIETEGTE